MLMYFSVLHKRDNCQGDKNETSSCPFYFGGVQLSGSEIVTARLKLTVVKTFPIVPFIINIRTATLNYCNVVMPLKSLLVKQLNKTHKIVTVIHVD